MGLEGWKDRAQRNWRERVKENEHDMKKEQCGENETRE